MVCKKGKMYSVLKCPIFHKLVIKTLPRMFNTGAVGKSTGSWGTFYLGKCKSKLPVHNSSEMRAEEMEIF